MTDPKPSSATAVPRETLRLHGRILLAEDIPDHQLLISSILQQADAQVVLVPDKPRSL